MGAVGVHQSEDYVTIKTIPGHRFTLPHRPRAVDPLEGGEKKTLLPPLRKGVEEKEPTNGRWVREETGDNRDHYPPFLWLA
jgi:hypothetical protein